MNLRGFLTFAVAAVVLLAVASMVRPHPRVLSGAHTWQVLIPAASPAVSPPQLTAKAAFLADAVTGQELYALNPDKELEEASTTKIITATLAIEHGHLDREVFCSKKACNTDPANIVMKPGEKITLRDLLYAMMLHSANDAAVAVAEWVGGTEAHFIDKMNDFAKRLGCTHTHFVTPNGLHNPGHYTTARDLATMTEYALRSPFFNELIKTEKHKIKRSINQKNTLMHRGHGGDRFLKIYPGADGVKTGYTHPAGRCYVGSATRRDSIGPRRLVSVVLHAADTAHETAALMNYGFGAWSRHEVLAPGATQGWIVDRRRAGRPVAPFRSTRSVIYTLRSDEAHRVQYHYYVRATAPDRAGARVGYLEVRVDGGRAERTPLVLARSIPAPASWKDAQIARLLLGCMALLTLGGSYGSFAKAHRRRRPGIAAQRRGVDSGGPGLRQRSNGRPR